MATPPLSQPQAPLPPQLSFNHIREPYDIFLVHTGQQKADVASTVHRHFGDRGYRCFLDLLDLEAARGSPTRTMEEAMETCRHFLVILSQSFLERPDPCAELQYAFKRMRWLQQARAMHGFTWQSLWIVLYDLSVEDYKEVWKETSKKLPPIHCEITLFKYQLGKGRFDTWTRLCDELFSQIQQHDQRDKATYLWRTQFLTNWSNSLGGSTPPSDFPRAHGIYNTDKEETGCRIRTSSLGGMLVQTMSRWLGNYERALSVSSLVHQRGMATGSLLDFYQRGSLVKSLLSLAMPQNQVFMLGFDGFPEELSGYLGDEEYRSTFVCWLLDRVFDMCDFDQTLNALDADTLVPFATVCFGCQHLPEGNSNRPVTPGVDKWEEIEDVELGDDIIDCEYDTLISLVGTGGGNEYVVGHISNVDKTVALCTNGSIKEVRCLHGTSLASSHDENSLRIEVGCIVPGVLCALLSLRGKCNWESALFHVYYTLLAMRELGHAIQHLPKHRQAPTKRRLQQLVRLQQNGINTLTNLGSLTRSALGTAEQNFRDHVDEVETLADATVIGHITPDIKALCSGLFRPVTIQALDTRLKTESAGGREGKVKFRWIEGTGTENTTIIAAFVSKLVNDISAEETLHVGNVDAGIKVVKGHLGTVATWPGAGGIIVDVEGSTICKRNWLSEQNRYVSVMYHETTIGWPLVTAALVKAFKLAGPKTVQDNEVLRLLNKSPGLLFRPYDLVATGHLGLNVSIENLFQVLDEMFGDGRPYERSCCLRLCLECLVLASCQIEGSLGVRLVRALKQFLRPISDGSRVTLVCNRVVPTDGLQYVDIGFPEPTCCALFGNEHNVWVFNPESEQIDSMSTPPTNPKLNGGLGMLSEFASKLY